MGAFSDSLRGRLSRPRDRNPPATPAADKGKFNGECQRTRCGGRPATWFHHDRRQFYCAPCADEIQRSCDDLVEGLFALSAHGEDPFEASGKSPTWRGRPTP